VTAGATRRLAIATALTAGIAACGVPRLTLAPLASVEIPADWVVVTTADGTMQLTLPPWLIVIDNRNAIHAQTAPPAAGAESLFRLFAVEPGMSIGPQKPLQLGPGQDLETWITEWFRDTNLEVTATTTVVTVPAGVAVRYDGVEAPGTPTARRVVALALTRPNGIAYVHVVGPVAAWFAHEADVDRLVQTFWVR
jgi:hypothetical protein